jgi:transcriptional regulator with XRE-family HTH domain
LRPERGATRLACSAYPPICGLSQAELAERVGGTDARQISRYEHRRVTPSLDAAVRIAEALDYLAIDGVPRRPLHVADHGLAERLGQLAELDDVPRDVQNAV